MQCKMHAQGLLLVLHYKSALNALLDWCDSLESYSQTFSLKILDETICLNFVLCISHQA